MNDAPVALVTGGGAGIGRAAAIAFGQAGYGVVIADTNLATAEETAETIRSKGTRAWAHRTDIAESAQVADLLHRIGAERGRLDCAFNNAGIGGGASPLADTDDAVWRRCLDVCLSGTFFCMREELRLMLKLHRPGAIVNNCSVLGVRGGLGQGSAAYVAAKHGIAGLTKNAASTYGGRGIRVNAVCPALIATGMGQAILDRAPDQAEQLVKLHPAGRPGTAAEVAAAVLWLCSEAASYVNGHLLAVDGGYLAR